MDDNEKRLIELMDTYSGAPNMAAIILQLYIQEHGPLSEEAGTKVKEILSGGNR